MVIRSNLLHRSFKIFKTIIYLFILNCAFHVHAFQQPKAYQEPKTYKEAVDLVIKTWNKDSLSTFKKSPLYIARWAGRKKIEALNYIRVKSDSIYESCYIANDNKPVHFEDVRNFIMQGVWKKLNADYYDFEKVDEKQYFESIYNIIKTKENNKIVDIASLPEWIYEGDSFDYGLDDEVMALRVQQAEHLINSNFESAPIAALYLTHYKSDSNTLLSWLSQVYDNQGTSISLPTYKPKNHNNVYIWNSISWKDFAVKCYGIKYDKEFTTALDYEKFISYCNNNYLAYWRYLKTPTLEDYKELIQHPKKLLEILILSNSYFGVNRHNDELIYYAGTNTDALVEFMELDGPLILFNPYPHDINKHGKYEIDYEIDNPKAVNALAKIADKLSLDELFSILEPETKVVYNSTLKTDDFNDYNTLTGFLLATQSERLINYHDKVKAFNVCQHYLTKEHISWPIKFFVTELLFRIDRDRALEHFNEKFKTIDDDSFTRQGILWTLIKYDFENQKEFIENWYWKIRNIDLNHSPTEEEIIMKCLQNTNNSTLVLYNKIVSDPRY